MSTEEERQDGHLDDAALSKVMSKAITAEASTCLADLVEVSLVVITSQSEHRSGGMDAVP